MSKKSAVQEPTESISYEERVAKRDAIRQRVKALKEENPVASSDTHKKNAVAEETAMELRRFQKDIKAENDRMGHNDKNFMDPWQKVKFNRLKSAAAAAEEAAKSATARKETIRKEIDKLESDLENFGYLLGVEDVLRYQEDVANAEKRVTEIQNLIAEQKEIIETARLSEPESLDALLKKREDILADISMGTATDKDLKSIDEQIAALNTAIEEFNETFNKLAGNTSQVIAGLQRKLETSEEDLILLRAKGKDIIQEYLMGRAESLGEEYVKAALLLTDKFRQISAIDTLMGYPSKIRDYSWSAFKIPLFRLKACSEMGYINDRQILAAAKRALDSEGEAEALAEEKERLAVLGIQVSGRLSY